MSFFKKIFNKGDKGETSIPSDGKGLSFEDTEHGLSGFDDESEPMIEQQETIKTQEKNKVQEEMNLQEKTNTQKEMSQEELTPPQENSIYQEKSMNQEEKVEEVKAQEDKVEEDISIEEASLEEDTKEQSKKSFIKRLFGGLSKTRDSILKGVDDVLSNFKHIDEELYEELEEALIIADFGVETTLKIMEQLKQKVKTDKIVDPTLLKSVLQEIITNILTAQPTEQILSEDRPTVILVIGVNGVGKTTSIGKMAHLFKTNHKKVLVAAADTFRAAAIQQLQIWTDRAGVDLIKHEEGTDAAAVVFDAIAAAKSRKTDVLICDTAGRLQNKTNLMKELEKISRIISREYPNAKRETLIVLDATTGQNAISQVKLFKEVADINGIILTKLDGTAKGGAIVGIYESLKVPVKYIGVGEKIDDLQPFDAKAFATALFKAE